VIETGTKNPAKAPRGSAARELRVHVKNLLQFIFQKYLFCRILPQT
jgi:hypothetical protein